MIAFLQTARGRSFTSIFRHLGALGLFFLAILDSSPLPTFGGPDILIAILAGSHRNPWWEYAAVATAGSIIGAYFTFRLARKAGAAYLDSKFGSGKVSKLLEIFEKWGTGALVAWLKLGSFTDQVASAAAAPQAAAISPSPASSRRRR